MIDRSIVESREGHCSDRPNRRCPVPGRRLLEQRFLDLIRAAGRLVRRRLAGHLALRQVFFFVFVSIGISFSSLIGAPWFSFSTG